MGVDNFSDYEKYHRAKRDGPNDSQAFYWSFGQQFQVDPIIIQCEEDAMEYFSKEPGYEGVRYAERRMFWLKDMKERVATFLKKRHEFYTKHGLNNEK